MDSVDSLATGLLFLLCGAGAVLGTLSKRYSGGYWAVSILVVLFMGAPWLGMDVPVRWPAFVEVCLAIGAILFVVALVRAARSIIAGDDRATW